MSAKRNDKSEWLQCPTCQAYFLKAILIKHKESCREEVSLFENEDVSLFDNSFILNDVFYGQVKCYSPSIGVKLPTDKSDLVLVNPSTIKMTNLQVANMVVVICNSKQCYGTIWPSSSVQLHEVVLQAGKFKSLNVSETDIVQVKKADVFPILATKVTLAPVTVNSAEVFNIIHDVLLNELDDTNLMCGDMLVTWHYGEEHWFIVNSIHGDIDANVCDILYKLENMNLNSTSSISLSSSTPKKQNSSVVNKQCLVYHVMFNETKLELLKSNERNESITKSDIIETPIGGLLSQKVLFDEIITQPFKNSLLYTQCGIHIPHGILVYGPSGTGKTCFVKNFVSSVPTIYSTVVSGPELTSKYQGETENNLRTIFKGTLSKAPSLLIIDEFDAICPTLNSNSSESEKRIVATLCSLMDSIKPTTLFVVVAITNKLDNVDLSLRRSGRFDTEVEIGIPNALERLDIIKKIFGTHNHILSEENLVELSEITHGYAGADISALYKESCFIAVRRLHQNNNDFAHFCITFQDVKDALCKIGPSAMKELTVDIPKVYWSDVGGQHQVKQKLREAIEWPLKHPDVFVKMGITPPRGLLMYGPPGCSKTLMAKALATESGLNFISIKGPELFNKYLGESERAVRRVFQKARAASPSIIFFDEIDAISVQRSQHSDSNNAGDRVLAQILTEMDGVEPLDGVIIVAATNRPDIIDPALLRPGRIDRLIYVPLPDAEARKEIFDIQFRTIPVSSDVSINKLVEMSDGYSGAEICSLCRESALSALRENFDSSCVMLQHFENVFNQIKPGTSKHIKEFYETFLAKTTSTI